MAAAAAATYAILDVEDAKDENRQEANRAVNSVKADLEVLREQVIQRLDTVESDVGGAADAQTLSKVQDDLAALDKRVKGLDQGASTDNLATRLDDLEQRIEDLEQKSD